MQTVIDRTLAILLLLGAGVGHTAGSILGYHDRPMVLLWSLSASVLGVMVGLINLLRSYRRADRPLAWLALGGNLAWLAISIAFGEILGRFFDPRVLTFVVLTCALGYFSLRGALSERV
jgi:hypothetical protein